MCVLLILVNEVYLVVNFPQRGQFLLGALENVTELFISLLSEPWNVVLC